MKSLNHFSVIGFMGAGKSTLYESVNLQNFYSIDLDQEFQKCHEVTPAQFIQNKGIKSFRDQEYALLKRILNQSFRNLIIYLGGGTLDLKESKELIFNNFKTIYLQTSYEVSLKRVNTSKEFRPLFNNKAQELYEKRKPIYQNADFVIKTDHLSIKDLNTQFKRVIHENSHL